MTKLRASSKSVACMMLVASLCSRFHSIRFTSKEPVDDDDDDDDDDYYCYYYYYYYHYY